MAAATGWKFVQGRKPNPTLMIQNCDLPPPVNVFTGVSNTTNKAIDDFNLMMMEMEFNCKRDKEDLEEEKVHDKLELLKALRLSQTRAREAEKRSRELGLENKSLSNAIIHQSMELIAYRNLVFLLELQVSLFKVKLKNHQGRGLKSYPNSCPCLYPVGSNVSEGKTSSEDQEFMSWVFALAIPIGIAGLGLAFAFRYLF